MATGVVCCCPNSFQNRYSRAWQQQPPAGQRDFCAGTQGGKLHCCVTPVLAKEAASGPHAKALKQGRSVTLPRVQCHRP